MVTALCMCGLLSDLVICNHKKTYDIIHVAKCLYLDPVLLNNITLLKLLNFKQIMCHVNSTYLESHCKAETHYTSIYGSLDSCKW